MITGPLRYKPNIFSWPSLTGHFSKCNNIKMIIAQIAAAQMYGQGGTGFIRVQYFYGFFVSERICDGDGDEGHHHFQSILALLVWMRGFRFGKQAYRPQSYDSLKLLPTP